MLRKVTGLAATSLLITALPLGAATAAAAGTPTVVIGTDLASAGIDIARIDCDDPTRAPSGDPTIQLALDQPPLGSRSLGWKIFGTLGSAIGPSVRITDPTKITAIKTQAHSPEDNLDGQAFITYYPSDPAPDPISGVVADPGYWQGVAAFGQDDEPGWHEVDATSLAYNWTHYTTAGVKDSTGGSLPPSEFFLTHDDGKGAVVGILYGCNGERFTLDAFQVDTAASQRTFDFEGYPSTTSLSASAKSVKQGKKVVLTATLKGAADSLAGETMVLRKRTGKATYVPGARAITNADGVVKFTLRPKFTGTYQVVHPASDAIELSKSKSVKVTVPFKVAKPSMQRSVSVGSSLTASGRVLPQQATKVLLQRKTGNGWTTVDRARTTSRGTYRLATRPSSSGSASYRVFAPTNALNTAAGSPAVGVSVAASGTSGGGGGSGDGNGPTPGPH